MSEPTNPYQAPETPITPVTDATLASPWIRLVAAIIDGIVLAPINYVLTMLLLKAPSMEKQMEMVARGEPWAPSRMMIILSAVIGTAVFIGVNYVFLKKGQTIGKLAMKLQIQNRHTGALIPVNDLILRRVLPLQGAALILQAIHPALAVLVLIDVLCIFRPGRNTIHDDLAQSKVVRLPGAAGF